MPSVAEAHRVAQHIFISESPGTFLGFNESRRGEGYLIVDASLDISRIVVDVIGAEPVRVLTTVEINADADRFGIQ